MRERGKSGKGFLGVAGVMRMHKEGYSSICTGLVCFLMQWLSAAFLCAQSPTPSNVFFSQGQAVYHPQDATKSQREALQNFQLQAIAQAAAAILSPAQLGRQYPLIQDKILKQPQRYVQTYQIFSEAPDVGGLYRVTGQVTISMDLLKKDLLALPPASPEGSASPSLRPAAPTGEPVVMGAGGRVGPAVETAGKTAASGREIFWAVAEKWEESWHLPAGRRDPDGPFAASMAQELQDYGWTVRFPEAGTLTPDEEGEVTAGEAIAQASALGLRHAVIGSVGSDENAGEELRVVAVLSLFEAASGKGQGEIHRELTMGEETSHEAAIELASVLAPQLDRQLRPQAESAATVEPAAAAESAADKPAATSEGVAQPEEAGELVVQIQSLNAYSDWLAVETRLREQAPKLQLKGLEIGPEGSRVRLLGADGASVKSLQGARLSNGAQVQVESLGAEGHAFRVTLTKPATNPAEPKP